MSIFFGSGHAVQPVRQKTILVLIRKHIEARTCVAKCEARHVENVVAVESGFLIDWRGGHFRAVSVGHFNGRVSIYLLVNSASTCFAFSAWIRSKAGFVSSAS